MEKESTKIKENPKYKDRLFVMLFGNAEMRENTISLYNALNNTNYTKDADFKITTLEDVIYIKMKNDISLLINSYLSLWEQQSSYNPNMPLRGLMYFGKLYDAYVEENALNIYGSSLKKIPTPQYAVFYNGTRDMPSVKKLRLSDAFIHEDKSGEFEWTATMYNLNDGKNDSLLKKCKPLSDYMKLVNYIRSYQEAGYSVPDAVDKAVVRCIEENIFRDYLIKHRAEVLDMCLTEYNEKTFVDGIRAEGIEEGIELGIEQGMMLGIKQGESIAIYKLVQEGHLQSEIGAKILNISIEQLKADMEASNYKFPE